MVFLLCFLPGALLKPSLRAEPGPVIPRGGPVTFLCRGPVGAKSFRLEKDGRTVSSDQKHVSQDGSQGTEARFHFPSVSEDITGRYSCLYQHVFDIWSGLSESLELQVTEEDYSTPPTGPTSRDYTGGLAGMVLLILVAILVEAGLSQRRAPQGPQE
ncbi:PREDICTED: leukocyte-associated immunoglobulin-like receptor 2 [Myotis davidii]|uniref:leukocyte-associated immunoglobulin-like receptor 2 n=1 Tax=Myotis davidii TaxID=225400 RepID=UPI000767CF19|nr:PREDICTED: leukocyte-associated immunoglobulin-like receptor 2 [Myotis davidii]